MTPPCILDESTQRRSSTSLQAFAAVHTLAVMALLFMDGTAADGPSLLLLILSSLAPLVPAGLYATAAFGLLEGQRWAAWLGMIGALCDLGVTCLLPTLPPDCQAIYLLCALQGLLAFWQLSRLRALRILG